MHLSDTIGGWCFWNESFTEPIESPRSVVHAKVTESVFYNDDAKILELNSKSGLYPLYVAYSLYRHKLGAVPESSIDQSARSKIWKDVVARNLFVVCKTPMAEYITRRTLLGYDKCQLNTQYIGKLIEVLKDHPHKFVNSVCRGNAWNNEVFAMKKLKFDAVVGNPPYQLEVAKKQSETNGQAPRKNIFQYFQNGADAIKPAYTSMIYPAGRWIHRSGKGMDEFGFRQINDVHLSRLDYYQNSEDVFNSVAIADGISIVFKDFSKTSSGFMYVYHNGKNCYACEMQNPGKELIPLDPNNGTILNKIRKFIGNNELNYLSDKILSRQHFGIESDFVEKNPKLVKPYSDDVDFDLKRDVKLYTNDKAGKAGRSQWYVANRDVIRDNRQTIDEWKVVVSSANAGGQKRDWAIEIFDNHSAFGRSRVGLGSFKTEIEATNFYNYCKTFLVRFLFLMTDESLTSLAKAVPDFGDYTTHNEFLDFSKDLNHQLYSLFGLTEDEVKHVEDKIIAIDAARSRSH